MLQVSGTLCTIEATQSVACLFSSGSVDKLNNTLSESLTSLVVTDSPISPKLEPGCGPSPFSLLPSEKYLLILPPRLRVHGDEAEVLRSESTEGVSKGHGYELFVVAPTQEIIYP
jgi:hypothetical protein